VDDFSGLSDLDSGQLRAMLSVLGDPVEDYVDDGQERLLRARLCRILVCAVERYAVSTEIVAEPGAIEQLAAVDRQNIIESVRGRRIQETMMLTNWRARRLAVIVNELAELFSRGRHPEDPQPDARDEQQLWALIENTVDAVADALPVLVSLMAGNDTLHSRAEDVDLITRRVLNAVAASVDLRTQCGLDVPDKS
jgi:hypothetical protein